MIPKLSQDGPQNEAGNVSRWSQDGPTLIPNVSQDGSEMIPKSFQDGPQMIPRWSQHGSNHNDSS